MLNGGLAIAHCWQNGILFYVEVGKNDPPAARSQYLLRRWPLGALRLEIIRSDLSGADRKGPPGQKTLAKSSCRAPCAPEAPL